MLIEVLHGNGFFIPTLCYDKRLTPQAACRLCLVEVEHKGRTRIVTSCNYPVSDGMTVHTETEEIKEMRKTIMEMLLARCPDIKALTSLAKKLGVEGTPYPLENENCILCGLCVRACDEIAQAHAISFSKRGLDKKVSTPFDVVTSDCINCNECVKVCPTGAVELLVKEYSQSPDCLASGHRLCAGCTEPIIIRQVLHGTRNPVVVANATGCAEVSTSIYPFTSWKVPWIHSAFENAAATISGVEAAYKIMKRKGLIKEDIKFVAFGGDGGTYDIGFQALSGAAERGHDFLYVCFNNEAYMNTGIQRSGATPLGATTTTSPAGSVIPGKKEYPKDLTEIMAAHKIPYVAQSSPGYYNDLIAKVSKAFSIHGPKFINVLAPCPRGWRFEPDVSIEIARMASESCVWPLYEVQNGKHRLTGYSKLIAEGTKQKIPAKEYLEAQGRFRHLFTEKNNYVLEDIQKRVDRNWQELLKMCGY